MTFQGSKAGDPAELPSRRRVLRFGAALPALGVVLPALAVGACANLVPGRGPAPDLYRLTPKSTFDEDLPDVTWQMVVPPPLADAGLDTVRIGLQRLPTRVEYYALADWVDRAPFMVQTLIIESFENSGRIIGVGREASGLNVNFSLTTELREFQAFYYDSSLPRVRVGLNAKLIMLPERIIVANQSFESIVQAERDELQLIVEAFDEALGKVLRDLVGWTLRAGEEMYQRRERLLRS